MLIVFGLQGFPGNEATLSQILSTCIQSGQWQNAYKAWSMMQLSGTLPSRDLQAALLQVLRDAHQWQAVLSIYQAMLQAKVHTAACMFAYVCTC